MSAAVKVTRADLVEAVALCRAEGWLFGDIAANLGISYSYANDLYNDPDGSKTRERKRRYGGSCVDCGKRTDGSNGPKKASKRCAACAAADQTVTEHGTHAMYENHGCRCDVCRGANTERHRHWQATTTAPIPHGANGYRNYGCRCDECRTAHTAEYRAFAARHLAAGDYTHGTTTGYAYGCKCDECRAAKTAYRREYVARKKAANA